MKEEKLQKFFNLAKYQAKLFSKDPSTKVCSLFVHPESLHILSTGFNGMPRGFDEKIESRWQRPQKYKYVVHAEANGIYNACRSGVSLKDSLCFSTFFPCSECTKALIQVGIRELITEEPDFCNIKYKEDWLYSLEMFKELNIKITYIDNVNIV